MDDYEFWFKDFNTISKILSNLGKPNDSTGDSWAGTPCLKWLIGPTFTQIVVVEMNDTTAPYYGVWADELNLIFEEVEFSLAVFISLKVTQVSHVTVACARATVMLPKGIEMRG